MWNLRLSNEGWKLSFLEVRLGGKTPLPLTGGGAGGGDNAYPTPHQALLPRKKAHVTQLHKRLMNRLALFDRSPL
jgi:hypothetical protein